MPLTRHEKTLMKGFVKELKHPRYMVSSIMAKKLKNRRVNLPHIPENFLYLVWWEDYGMFDVTWEPFSNVAYYIRSNNINTDTLLLRPT